MQTPKLEVVDDAAAVADRALTIVTRAAEAAVRARGRFTLALSGGSTPKALYERLARHPELPWTRMELCFGDERAVPPDHPESNARMVHEALTGHPFVPPERVHRIRGELPPREAAADYTQTLRALFGNTSRPPRFDLVLLGLGSDGHTASLFPHSHALTEHAAWVMAHHVAGLVRDRITLTFPVLNAAAEVLFLVAGADKARTLSEVLEGSAPIYEIPARGIVPEAGDVTFVADRAAASCLTAHRP